MNELDLKALQITQMAVARLIEEVAARAKRTQVAELMTAQEVAQVFRISLWRFYHAYKGLGLVPVRRLGRKLLFRREDVRRLLDETPVRRGRPPKRLAATPSVQGTFSDPVRI